MFVAKSIAKMKSTAMVASKCIPALVMAFVVPFSVLLLETAMVATTGLKVFFGDRMMLGVGGVVYAESYAQL